MTVTAAVWAFLSALVIAALLTPFTAVIARRFGAIDMPRVRGLATRATPRLGGLAIFAAVAAAGALWLPATRQTTGIFLAAVVIVIVGAIDDAREIAPAAKLLGQATAATIAVRAGLSVPHITLPFLGPVELGGASGPLTVLGLVAVMNIINLSDGVDGLAAGVTMIGALTFTALAFDLGKNSAAVLAALIAGAALGFLLHNVPPARQFMGDCGSNLLGLLLGCAAVQGTVKTNALVGLLLPLVILGVPLLDTSFVIAKRLKYRRPVHHADANHFHHRLARIGFSQRRTLVYLYAWTLAFAGLALAMRFLPYSDHHGHYNTGWTLVLLGVGVLTVAASVYLVLVLEIIRFSAIRSAQLRRSRPEASEPQLIATIEAEIDTGEYQRVTR